MYKNRLDILSNCFQTRPLIHLFICNPNCNTIVRFTNGGISQVNGAVRSREQWEGVSVVSI